MKWKNLKSRDKQIVLLANRLASWKRYSLYQKLKWWIQYKKLT